MIARRLLIVLFILVSVFSYVGAQDTIRLKDGSIIESVIIQMDFNNVYYVEWNSTNTSIQSISIIGIDEIIFRGKNTISPLESLEIVGSKNRDNASTLVDTLGKVKIEEHDVGEWKKFGLGLNIFPIIDFSMNLDIEEKLNLEFGLGAGYTFFGTRIFFKDRSSNWRPYMGLYYYNIRWVDSKVGIDFPFGYNYRNDGGLSIRLELGLLIFENGIVPLPKIGFGIRL